MCIIFVLYESKRTPPHDRPTYAIKKKERKKKGKIITAPFEEGESLNNGLHVVPSKALPSSHFRAFPMLTTYFLLRLTEPSIM